MNTLLEVDWQENDVESNSTPSVDSGTELSLGTLLVEVTSEPDATRLI
jgi:hypothetical protein